MKKIISAVLALCMCAALFAGCHKGASKDETDQPQNPPVGDTEVVDPPQNPPTGDTEVVDPPAEDLPSSEVVNANLSADGYVKGKISDFSKFEGTDAYRKVKTADELISAIVAAKYHYTNVWDEDTKTYTQEPDTEHGYTQENFEGTVHVIEIENDLDLGYDNLSSAALNSGVVEDFSKKEKPSTVEKFTMSDMFSDNGISQIKIETTSNLLVYSKNGVKLTHCGFKLTSDTNVVFRNLSFDEIWQWEDAAVSSTGSVGDYDAFGWAYFKIAFCGYIWIDHCTFGKSYDGQIDYSNPVYNANAGTAFRAPYGADGGNGLHISWCSFNAGSDDTDGYLYKMMEKIEQHYQSGGTNYRYYKALRDGGASFEDVLYGVAIPQKKGFLCGDDAKSTEADYTYNLSLQVSFANCKFINLEDRLPKLRGGNAYMYNCVVDASQYYTYRAKLKSMNAASKVSAVNSTWKCGLVSQGIVCGNGGSVKAENCIYSGIEYLLKNNDTKNSAPYVNGGYELVNCSYNKTGTGTEYVGSSSSAGNGFTNDTPSKLKTDYFSWHTQDNAQPFTISAISLDILRATLNESSFGAGVNSDFKNLFLNSVYTD